LPASTWNVPIWLLTSYWLQATTALDRAIKTKGLEDVQTSLKPWVETSSTNNKEKDDCSFCCPRHFADADDFCKADYQERKAERKGTTLV